ncbi:hypothetical protein [Chitinophaga sp. GbtcB8]|uniref:hypothetical protein n=1 Tax=Chitinophaga sp. GbtcB8 TaxID=2824753 RepID=UPI001C309430|nr:hypothetical protein [Chitinophaga sp. GbtcB8]
MSNANAYITASCVIRDQQVFSNGSLLWQDAPGAELTDFLRKGYDRFSGQYPKFHKMDALSKLGWLAAEVLLRTAPVEDHLPEQVAIVLSNRSASLDTDLRYYNTVKDIPSPALFVYTLANIVIGEICIRHGFKGEHIFFTTGGFDARQIMAYAQILLDTGAATACLCGWVEVMEQQYEVVLYLVERQQREESKLLTVEEMKKIYDLKS